MGLFNIHKHKRFRDSVHGYIDVPEVIVKQIVDTELFQRLHYIEQTGMKSLFPAARHDRFIHSLGVFHLGTLAFESFRNNATQIIVQDLNENPGKIFSLCHGKKTFGKRDKKRFAEDLEKWFDKYYLLFSIACLTHDCAHSPFSHTYEKFYSIPLVSIEKDQRIKKHIQNTLLDARASKDPVVIATLEKARITVLDYEMLQQYTSEQFRSDYLSFISPSGLISTEIKSGVNEHEKLSAIMVRRKFRGSVREICSELLPEYDSKDLGKDLEFIARAITGTQYTIAKQSDALHLSLMNCMVEMLNSKTVDVDGLDYIVRDAYNSGMDNWSIDYRRILDSYTIVRATKYDNYRADSQLDLNGIWIPQSEFSATSDQDPGKLYDKSMLQGNFNIRLDHTPTADNWYKMSEGDKIEFDGAHDNPKTYSTSERQTTIYPNSTTRGYHLITKIRCSSACHIEGKFIGLVNGSVLKFDPLPGNLIYYHPAFDKRSLSVLQSVIDARNHEYTWVYAHPKVLYHSDYLQCFLLRITTRFLCCKLHKKTTNFDNTKIEFDSCNDCKHREKMLNDTPDNGVINRADIDGRIPTILGLWSYVDSFPGEDEFSNAGIGVFFDKSNDYDITALFKSIYLENETRRKRGIGSSLIRDEFSAYFSRKHRKPLWKSVHEYKRLFARRDATEEKGLIDKITDKKRTYQVSFLIPDKNSPMKKELKKLSVKSPVFVKGELKLKTIDGLSMYITDGKNTSRYCDMIKDTRVSSAEKYFYIFAEENKEVAELEQGKLDAIIKVIMESDSTDKTKGT